jgi:hypothetical protein
VFGGIESRPGGKSEVFDEAIASFAMIYADQTIRDHAALVAARAVKSAKAISPGSQRRRRT